MFSFNNTMKSFAQILMSTLLFIGILYADAEAGERWYIDAEAKVSAGQYSDSLLRDDFYSAGMLLNVDYIDIYSFAFTYNYLKINFKDSAAGAFDVSQDAFTGRFQYHFYNDALAGKVTAQLVAHNITNTATMAVSADVIVLAPKITYTSYSKDLLVGFEYARSDYAGRRNLVINQYTPSIGFGFNQNDDWLQINAYFIQSNNVLLSYGEDSLSSIRLKWRHLFESSTLFAINNFFIDALAGERVFAVDNESFDIYNLEGVQQESVLLGLGWRPAEDFDITAIAGVEKFTNKLIDNDYQRQYLYLRLTGHW